MTVASATSSASYTGNGSTTAFAIPFYFLQNTDVVIQTIATDGTPTTAVLDSDYSLTGAGNEAGGTATFGTAPANGVEIYITRVVTIDQETAYPQDTPFPAASHEQALDKLTMIAQQLQRAINAALALTTADAVRGVSGIMPPSTPGSLIGWNAAGTGLTNVGSSGVGAGSITDVNVSDSAAVQSSKLAFTQGGTGAVAQTVAAKLAHTVHVADFGAVGDGVTLDDTPIANAIAYLSSINGGTLLFDAKTYAISETVAVTSSNIFLQGQGSSFQHSAGSGSTVATEFLWSSAVAGTMAKFESPSGAGNKKQCGGGVRGIVLNGNDVAAVGLYLHSWRHGAFSDMYVRDVTEKCYFLSNWLSTQLAEAPDTQFNQFERCQFSVFLNVAVQSADGFVLTSDNPGSSGGNASLNTFINCQGSVQEGTALHLIDADDNYFLNSHGFVVGGGWSCWLDGAWSNVFYGLAGRAKCTGTVSGSWNDSVDNVFLASDDTNGGTYPTVDAGCTLQYQGCASGWVSLGSSKMVVADSTAQLQTELPNIGTDTLRIHNGSRAGVALTDGTNEWGLSIDSSGNLLITRRAGSGLPTFANTPQMCNFTANADAPVTGYLTIHDILGNVRKLAVIS